MNTSRILVVAMAAILLAAKPVFTQKIIFVAPCGKGDGSSWLHASHDLQAVLQKAERGAQVWVAEGLYFPTEGKNRSMAFKINDGVGLFGGFAGKEKAVSERKMGQHPTILSGNIGSADPEDNSYNVIRLHGVGPTTIIDGFIITGGRADGDKIEGNFTRSGGGLFNDGSKEASNPQISNCVFLDNFAKDGGAVYNYGRGGDASPTFIDCEFTSNAADLDGGAVNNDGRGAGKSSPAFLRCRFESNKGNYGGALFCDSVNGASQPLLTTCTFSKNQAYVRGGAIFQIMTSETDSKWSPDGVVFEKNQAFYQESADVGVISMR